MFELLGWLIAQGIGVVAFLWLCALTFMVFAWDSSSNKTEALYVLCFVVLAGLYNWWVWSYKPFSIVFGS